MPRPPGDRKSTRLNSSHEWISYAVFCSKKKTETLEPEGLRRQPGSEGQGHLQRMQRKVAHFFFNHPAPTEIYTLSLHDALPIFLDRASPAVVARVRGRREEVVDQVAVPCRSEEHSLNSSHEWISYAVFCLKKQKKMQCPSSSPRNIRTSTSPTRRLDSS